MNAVISNLEAAHVALEKLKPQFLIVCGGLGEVGGGFTPPMGLVTAVHEAVTLSGSSCELWILIRPRLGNSYYNQFEKLEIAHSLKSLRTAKALLPLVKGIISGAEILHENGKCELDETFAKELIKWTQPDLGVLYHRGWILFDDIERSVKQLVSIGWKGFVIGRIGSTEKEKNEYVTKAISQLENCCTTTTTKLRFLIHDDLPPTSDNDGKDGINSNSYVGPLLVEDPYKGALLPWRRWEVETYLFRNRVVKRENRSE